MFTGISAAAVPQVWPSVLPYVERFLAKSKEHRWDASDIYNDLVEHDKQLWVSFKGDDVGTFVITEIINYPRCRECNVFMVCGELQADWRESTETLVEWAAAQGCHYFSATARPGFTRLLGWETRQTYIVRGV